LRFSGFGRSALWQTPSIAMAVQIRVIDAILKAGFVAWITANYLVKQKKAVCCRANGLLL
jgi:hypothetical protein